MHREPRAFDATRFAIESRRLFGGLHTLRLTDLSTGRPVPHRGVVFAGKASVRRAVTWSIDRYLGRRGE